MILQQPASVPEHHGRRELIEAAETIHRLAVEGSVTGIVFGLSMRGHGRRYFIDVAGSLAADPTFARGVCAAMDDQLANMVDRQADASTTL